MSYYTRQTVNVTLKLDRECTHYTHSSERMFGALSDCGAGKGAMGYLTDLHKVLEVNPLDRKYAEKFGDDSSSEWHVVVRRASEDATGMHKRGTVVT